MMDQEHDAAFGRELHWSLSRPRPLRAMREFPGEYAPIGGAEVKS